MFKLKKDNKIKIPGFDLYIDIDLYNFNREYKAKLEENFLRGCRNMFRFK